MRYIMKLLAYLEETYLLVKDVIEKKWKWSKGTKGGLLSLLLAALAASVIWNILAAKVLIRASEIKIKAGHDF